MADPLRVNLGDPQVRRFLHGDPTSPLAPVRAPAVVQLAGDVPDPLGQHAGGGFQSTTHLDTGKQEVIVLFKDLILTVDVFALPGEPLHLHLQCPRCQKVSRVSAERKAIDFDPKAANPVLRDVLALGQMPPEVLAVAALGDLSIEPFECTWEIGGAAHVRGGVHTGASLCRLRLAIDHNRAKEA